MSKDSRKKVREFAACHLSSGHCEFPMSDLAVAGGVTIDPNVERRVGEYEIGDIVPHQGLIRIALQCTATE